MPSTTWTRIITTVWVQNDPDGSVVNAKMRNKVMQAASAKVTDVSGVAAGETPARGLAGQELSQPLRPPQTTIAYALGTGGQGAAVGLCSPTGQLVTRLVDGDMQPGAYQATWDGRDRFGSEVASGMYYYQLEVNNLTQSGRMVVLK